MRSQSRWWKRPESSGYLHLRSSPTWLTEPSNKLTTGRFQPACRGLSFARARRDLRAINFARLLRFSIFRMTHAMLDRKTRHWMRPEGMPEPLLTLQEAVDYLRLTPGALYPKATGGRSLVLCGFGWARRSSAGQQTSNASWMRDSREARNAPGVHEHRHVVSRSQQDSRPDSASLDWSGTQECSPRASL